MYYILNKFAIEILIMTNEINMWTVSFFQNVIAVNNFYLSHQLYKNKCLIIFIDINYNVIIYVIELFFLCKIFLFYGEKPLHE